MFDSPSESAARILSNDNSDLEGADVNAAALSDIDIDDRLREGFQELFLDHLFHLVERQPRHFGGSVGLAEQAPGGVRPARSPIGVERPVPR